jgi:hypothetical protein
MQMLTGFWVSQSLHVAARLEVADALKNGPRSTAALAQTLNAHEENLYRLLRALASIGVFRELEDRMFELTPIAELLQSDTPNSMRPMAMMLGEENYQSWGQLHQAVRHGRSPFEAVYGMQVYEYFGQNPAAADQFNAAMTALVRNDNAAILEAYAFDRFSTLIDVGGGHGTLLSVILKRFPRLSGVLFDLPQVVAKADAMLREAGVEDRCRLETGNFFETIPAGGDGYVLSRVLHGFSDEDSVTILKNIHAAMPAHGRLLLMEFLIEPGNHPETARTKLMDVNMMVFAPGGRDRTRQEYAQLLESGGFQLSEVFPTSSGIAVLEAVRR